jgi:hypothetical protein
MKKRTVVRLLLLAALLVVLVAALSPWLIHGYWSVRSSNTVRRGNREIQGYILQG